MTFDSDETKVLSCFLFSGCSGVGRDIFAVRTLELVPDLVLVGDDDGVSGRDLISPGWLDLTPKELCAACAAVRASGDGGTASLAFGLQVRATDIGVTSFIGKSESLYRGSLAL